MVSGATLGLLYIKFDSSAFKGADSEKEIVT